MAGLKKGLDKFDLGTPMIASLFGGTADYGEAADEQEEDAKQMEALNRVGRPTRRQTRQPRDARKSNAMT